MTTTVTGKNQVTIPAALARQLGLKPGARLDWKAGKKPGTLVIEVQPDKRQLIQRIQELGRGFKNRKLVDELVQDRGKEWDRS